MGYFSIPSNKVFVKENKGKGGRPPYDYLLMFKIVILQKMYNLSDDQTEYQINVSSLRFLGLGLSDVIPDAKTIWNFKEPLLNALLALISGSLISVSLILYTICIDYAY